MPQENKNSERPPSFLSPVAGERKEGGLGATDLNTVPSDTSASQKFAQVTKTLKIVVSRGIKSGEPSQTGGEVDKKNLVR